MEQLSLLLSPFPCPPKPGHQAVRLWGLKPQRKIDCNCKRKSLRIFMPYRKPGAPASRIIRVPFSRSACYKKTYCVLFFCSGVGVFLVALKLKLAASCSSIERRPGARESTWKALGAVLGAEGSEVAVSPLGSLAAPRSPGTSGRSDEAPRPKDIWMKRAPK